MPAVRETWVHPVTIGTEAPRRRVAVWRFRLLLLLLLLALTVLAFWGISHLRGSDSPASQVQAPVVSTSGRPSSEHL